MTEPTLDQLILVRLAPEIMLKARPTRNRFQAKLVANIRKALKRDGVHHKVEEIFGRIMVHTDTMDAACDTLSTVFGISSFSPIEAIVEGSMEAVIETAKANFFDRLSGKTYAVRAKILGTKVFSTQDLERQVGAALNAPDRKVNLTKPDVTVRLDIHEGRTHFHTTTLPGTGGLPTGTQGKAVSLISGGFDSAVSSWQIMRRGAIVDYVFCNLAAGDYERSVTQVVQTLVNRWGAGQAPRLFVIDFAPMVDQIMERVTSDYKQIILKRLFYRAASGIAHRVKADAVITGEALGQVSSQTLSNLKNIDLAAEHPVLRPLIATDKQEIIDLARRIGTAELSEHIPEYCGLTSKRPATSSSRHRTEEEEAKIDLDLLDQLTRGCKVVYLEDLTAEEIAGDGILVDDLPADMTVIDCQTDAQYAEWHIDGALHCPPNRLPIDYDTLLDKDTTYVLYCQIGTTAPVLAEYLRDNGYKAYAFGKGVKALQ